MELDVTLRKGFRLGDWDVRPIEGMLNGAQGVRHLQPKTMDVLVCLASQSGQVLTRDELIARVWNGHAVSDEPLTRCIHEIRRALGDHCGEARYIRTIPKRGYQLLPAVSELAEPCTQSSLTANPVKITAESPALSAQAAATADIAGPDGTSSIPGIVHDGRVRESADDEFPEDREQNPARLFWEVTRQRVLWVGALYVSLAWIFVQLARYAELETAAGRAFPDWLVPTLVIIVLLGFPVAIFFAWVRQISADQPQRARSPALTFNNAAALLLSRRGIDVVLVTLVITGLAGFALDFAPPVAAQVSGPGNKRIAVIPFSQVAGDSELAWLGASLAQDLEIRLRDYGALDISSQGRKTGSAAEQLDARQLGELLRVQYLLEGVVVTSDSGLRINVRVTDATTGFEVWSNYYSEPIDALARVQLEMTRDIAAALQIDGSYVGASAVQWPADIAGAVYLSYLQGLHHLASAADKDSPARAAAWFDRALAEDPRLIMAGVGSCRAYTRELEIIGSAWAHGKAHQVCAGVVEQAPKLADARLAQADFYRVAGFNRDAIDQYEWVVRHQVANADAWLGLGLARSGENLPEDAEEAFEKARQMHPQDAATQMVYTRFLLDQRRYAEAVESARTLVQLDRDSSAAYTIFAEALFDVGEFAAAVQAGRQAVARDLENRAAIMTIAASYYYLGKYARAGSIYRQAARLGPEDAFVTGALANALAQIGDADTTRQARAAYEQARQLAERALDSSRPDKDARLALAFFCATLGDISCAERYQSSAAEEGFDSGSQYYWTALIQAQLGNLEAASEAARTALEQGFPQALIIGEPLLARVWSQYRFATVQLAPFASVAYQPQ